MASEQRRIDLAWGLIALVALAIATSVYFLDRPAGRVYFIPDGFNPLLSPMGLFGDIGYNLPSFVHAFSMILITAAILSSRGLECVFVSLGWLFVEAGFEIGQANALGHDIANSIPDWFHSVPVLEAQRAYFLNGTFDSHDLLAATLGAGAAYLVMRFSQRTY